MTCVWKDVFMFFTAWKQICGICSQPLHEGPAEQELNTSAFKAQVSRWEISLGLDRFASNSLSATDLQNTELVSQAQSTQVFR